jgi:hypothetical protein
MRLGQGTTQDHPSMPTGEDYYILYYKGENIEVMMRRNRKDGSSKMSDNPYRMCWDILAIKPEFFDISKQEIIDIITEAEQVDDYAGFRKFVTSIDVRVKYIGGQN